MSDGRGDDAIGSPALVPSTTANKQCLWCSFTSSRLCDLLAHMQTAHPSDYQANKEVQAGSSLTKQYRCFSCNAAFSRSGNLMDHVSKYHHSDLSLTSTTVTSSSAASISTATSALTAGSLHRQVSHQSSTGNSLGGASAATTPSDEAKQSASQSDTSAPGASSALGAPSSAANHQGLSAYATGSSKNSHGATAARPSPSSALSVGPSPPLSSSSASSAAGPLSTRPSQKKVSNSVAAPGDHICPYCKRNCANPKALVQHLSQAHKECDEDEEEAVSSPKRRKLTPQPEPSEHRPSTSLTKAQILPNLSADTSKKLQTLIGKNAMVARLLSVIEENHRDPSTDSTAPADPSAQPQAAMSSSSVSLREELRQRTYDPVSGEWKELPTARLAASRQATGPGPAPKPSAMTRDRRYKCFWCEQTFRKRGKLMDHIDDMHKHTKDQSDLEAEIHFWEDPKKPSAHSTATSQAFSAPTAGGMESEMPGGSTTRVDVPSRGPHFPTGRPVFSVPTTSAAPSAPAPPKNCPFVRESPMHLIERPAEPRAAERRAAPRVRFYAARQNPLNSRLPVRPAPARVPAYRRGVGNPGVGNPGVIPQHPRVAMSVGGRLPAPQRVLDARPFAYPPSMVAPMHAPGMYRFHTPQTSPASQHRVGLDRQTISAPAPALPPNVLPSLIPYPSPTSVRAPSAHGASAHLAGFGAVADVNCQNFTDFLHRISAFPREFPDRARQQLAREEESEALHRAHHMSTERHLHTPAAHPSAMARQAPSVQQQQQQQQTARVPYYNMDSSMPLDLSRGRPASRDPRDPRDPRNHR